MRSWSLFAAACAVVFTMACGQTDAGITSSVKTKLAADDAVKAYQVDVDTRDKVVTLTGTVNSVVARERAVTLARETDGVREVVDNIRISDAAATTGIDDAGAAAARESGNAIKDGAEAVGDAAKKGAEATADGAKKVGSEVKDVFTGDK
jgi:hypothetical protein